MSEHPEDPVSYFLEEAQKLEETVAKEDAQFQVALRDFNNDWAFLHNRNAEYLERAAMFRKFAENLNDVYDKAWRYDEASK